MITTANELHKALKQGKFAGVILYEGPSMIDGAPIVVIANRITAKSTNDKTGHMVQTFIIRADVTPLEAIKQGLDYSVCGDCLARPANAGFCYVNVGRSVRSVHEAYKRGRYAKPGIDYDPAILPQLFAGMVFRLGTYGDPAAAPFQIWRRATLNAAGMTGYTHQWRRFPTFKLLTMASCDTEQDMMEAKAAGWRTFRIRLSSDQLIEREIVCPASHEAGAKTQCASCKACGGYSSKAKADLAIIAHGPTASRYAKWRSQCTVVTA